MGIFTRQRKGSTDFRKISRRSSRPRVKGVPLLVRYRFRGKRRFKFRLPRSSILDAYSKFLSKSRRLRVLPSSYEFRHLKLNSVVSRYIFDREVRNSAHVFASEKKVLSSVDLDKNSTSLFLAAHKPAHWASFSDDSDEESCNFDDFFLGEELFLPTFSEVQEFALSPEVNGDDNSFEKKAKIKDPFFDRFDFLSSAFVSVLCRRGLKLKAERLLEDTLKNLGESIKSRFKKFQFVTTPVLNFVIRYFFLNALENVKPLLSLKKQVVAGVIRSSPIVTSEQKRLLVAIRWIVAAAKNRSELPFSKALSSELFDAFFSKGRAVSKRSELHSVVISSRAFLRLKSEKGQWSSEEAFTMAGFRTGLRTLLRTRLINRLRQILAKIRSSKTVWRTIRFRNRSWKRATFVKPSRKEINSRSKKFLLRFNSMNFSEKIRFLLGFNRFTYVYRTKFVSRWAGFFNESLIGFSSSQPISSTSSESGVGKISVDIHSKIPVFVTTFPSNLPPTPRRRFPYRPKSDRIFFDSIMNRHWLRPRYVLVMYRRERPTDYFFAPKKRNYDKFNKKFSGFSRLSSHFKRNKKNYGKFSKTRPTFSKTYSSSNHFNATASSQDKGHNNTRRRFLQNIF